MRGHHIISWVWPLTAGVPLSWSIYIGSVGVNLEMRPISLALDHHSKEYHLKRSSTLYLNFHS